ncbi:MAG: group 1 glycosyl transferase [Candidatus Doudnabacteria bacterium Gr01-1014_77]|uniref:Group 1 glycosyl transferase n=1 Tax=Candidatus Doudnabacteria bacterium Gr01-1014_77 TaxID=2017133 RepID=A0A554JAR6_9BACT|nr:MAG: group 1 glycosyl transferase [Candidatus Doudnabacteria bacterium Gr01-1014_77]
MKIGIEAERANIDNPTGVEHYAQQLILAISKQDLENEYVLYLRTKPSKWMEQLPNNFKIKIIPFPIFWTQLRISWEMFVHPVDVLFIMASALPLIHPKNSVVTIHDLAWEFYPETFKTFMRLYLRFSTWFACKFASSIIAVSEQTKKDIIQTYKVSDQKISVIYHGFDLSTEILAKASEEKLKEEQEKVRALPEKYILYISTLQPRKNVTGLIEAFLELKKEKQIEHSLVLVGGRGWLYESIMEKIKDHPEIIYCGYGYDRFAYLKKADLLVQPSFYEGFGMSLLDAFAKGVPVACSNVSSLPEVAGDAAIYFDPKNKQEMKSAIYACITDRALHDSLVVKGSERLKNFTWKKCAEQTLLVLKEKHV